MEETALQLGEYSEEQLLLKGADGSFRGIYFNQQVTFKKETILPTIDPIMVTYRHKANSLARTQLQAADGSF